MADIEYDFTNLRKKELQIMNKISKIVRTEMEKRVPIKTGLLWASIDSKVEGGNGTEITASTGSYGCEYAFFVEYYPEIILSRLTDEEYQEGKFKFGRTGEGTAEIPFTDWKALRLRGQSGSGQTIPFARSSDFFTKDKRFNAFKEVFR